MPIKGNKSIRRKERLSKTHNQLSNTQNQCKNISTFLLVFYKFSSRLFQIPNLVEDVYPSILLLQSFPASAFDLYSNSIMKYVIFQASQFSFSLIFQFNLCNLIFKVFVYLESREPSRKLENPFVV